MISVIVPMFNSEKTIENALNSVLNQTKIELINSIIVVDDGSIDDSYEIVSKYKKEHTIIPITLVKQSNQGVSTARNKGIKLAKTEWIALLDSDDEWIPTKIEKQVDAIKSNDEIDFIGGNPNDKDLKVLWKKLPYLYKANIKDLCLKTFPPTPTALFKRNIVDGVGYFDEQQHYGEDMNLFNKICVNFNYFHLQEQLVILNGGTNRKNHKGLSSNLIGMHNGNVKNIKELKENGNISNFFYMFLRVFYFVKLVRRYLLWKVI